MKKKIFRKPIVPGTEFKAPANITAGYQQTRGEFSFWYEEGAQDNSSYMIVATGHDFPAHGSLIQTIIMPDGFHVFHLIQL